MTGRFVAFEGGEASGKSTQARLLAERISGVLTREPGGTPFAEMIRNLILGQHNHNVVPRAEALLIAASRAQHVEELIRPSLDANNTVVTDRYVGSSLAYQGVARDLGVDMIRSINDWATSDLVADITILIDIPREQAWLRRPEGEPEDRLGSESEAFHIRVHDGYLELAASEPGWVVIDGVGSVEEVADRVWGAYEQCR